METYTALGVATIEIPYHKRYDDEKCYMGRSICQSENLFENVIFLTADYNKGIFQSS